MALKIAVGIAAAVAVFLAYVATRDGKFHYERSGMINATPQQIFPYLSSYKLCSEWSPYEKMDPGMKKSFSGPDGAVGSKMEFASDKSGTGTLEFLRIVPAELVALNLRMTKPFKMDNLVEYKLSPEGAGTRFTWSMSGEGGYITKLMTVFVDCDKMAGKQFEEGIQSLKTLVESKK